jgi:transcriptional regulator with XRE-family HTH domain
MPGENDDGMQPLLGERLRTIRLERDLSLATVSRETNISRSFLSLVENGQNEITIGRLVRLVTFYGIHISDFFADLAMAGEPRHVVRRAERRRVPAAGDRVEVHLLAPDEQRSMLATSVEMGPGGGTSPTSPYDGEELLHVVEGEVELMLEGEPPQRLADGDTAWCPGRQTYTLANRTDRPARVLAVRRTVDR